MTKALLYRMAVLVDRIHRYEEILADPESELPNWLNAIYGMRVTIEEFADIIFKFDLEESAE